ncbi:MAG TPA: SRPBCC family protein [Rhizobiaceae bacterium]|nr:SRPBCC family protein [Rhizobiaceae bacterium]
MSERSATHATFVIERNYPAAPARVFQAFSDPVAKRQWFGGPGETRSEMDFRVGGRETASGAFPDGSTHRFDARYHDIVPGERIVFSYDMHIDQRRISVSLATVEIAPQGTGSRLVFTEQGVFLDGYDDAGSRERGMIELLDGLGAFLSRQD